MTEDEEKYFHVEGSFVVHKDEDCYHVQRAKEVEELNSEEAEDYRTCHQCWYNDLSYEEKMERKRSSQRRSNRTVKITYR